MPRLGLEFDSLEGLAPGEQVAHIQEKILLQQAADKPIGSVPLTQKDFSNGSAPDYFYTALRNRLFRLGYLKSDNKRPSPVGLIRAVKKLQSECSKNSRKSLTVDGWVGPETWLALQEFFAFEEPTTLTRWMTVGLENLGLRRAINLRLEALGVRPELGEPITPEGAQEGLEFWRGILQDMGFAQKELDDVTLVRWAFDLDELKQAILENHRRIKSNYQSVKASSRKNIEHFLACLVRVDLWLLGYSGMAPSGKPITMRRDRSAKRSRSGSRQAKVKYRGLAKTLSQFYADQGVSFYYPSKNQAKHPNLNVLLNAIKQFDLLNTKSDWLQDDSSAEAKRVLRTLDRSKYRKEVENNWNAKEGRSRRWDGVRKVFGFIRRAVDWVVKTTKRVFDWFKEKITLAVRTIKQICEKAHLALGRAFLSLKDSLEWFTQREVPESNESIAMYHDGDGDFSVWTNTNSKNQRVRFFLMALRRRVQSLHDTLRWAGVAISVALIAAKGFSGVWWSIPRALIRLFMKLKKLKPDPVYAEPLILR